MKQVNYLILGAGPSGLGFAHTLLKAGETSFLVLEKEDVAGGLCRSTEVDGAPLDLGGGHFLDVKREEALKFMFQFLPRDKWQQYQRISRINLGGREVDYPLEANIWQLADGEQSRFLASIAAAGCQTGRRKPESFEKWVRWKLGDAIADQYLLPYNRKIWSCDLNQLGLYWLDKLPDVSYLETLASCRHKKAAGRLPAHGNFLYPKAFGYGEVWKRMGDALGERLLTSTPVAAIDLAAKVVNGEFQATRIINTIPWPLWPSFAEVPAAVKKWIAQLRSVSIDVDYHPRHQSTEAHWVYEPDEALAHHRRLYRTNFCPGSRGFWTETNSQRAVEPTGWRHRNEFAYPMPTAGKPVAMKEIGCWAASNGVIPLGRWGTWEHLNSDVAVVLGIKAAKECLANDGATA